MFHIDLLKPIYLKFDYSNVYFVLAAHNILFV